MAGFVCCTLNAEFFCPQRMEIETANQNDDSNVVLDELIQEFEELEDEIAIRPDVAIEGYKRIIQSVRGDDDAVKLKEKCIYGYR
jgi:hypothetical protein